MADVPIRAEEKHRREEGHVKTRQRLGWFSHKPRNAKGCQEPPEAGRAKKKKKKKSPPLQPLEPAGNMALMTS